MSTNVTVKLKPGRAVTSCNECQRRKQKCDREWPCNHCQVRKVPHLCQFPPDQKNGQSVAGGDGVAAVKRPQQQDPNASGTIQIQDAETELSQGLSKLGYMSTSDTVAFTRKALNLKDAEGGKTAPTDEVKTALRSVLPKLYTDLLVQNFLDISNYQYYTCFPAQLQAQCAEYWDGRANDRHLSPEFTCLLLQVCASSTQFLKDDLRKRLEAELSDSVQVLTERFHAAAMKLSAAVSPGQVHDPIIMVQQLFLGAVWFKYEAKMIEAWHALGAAIRAAQESGMHKDSDSGDLSEFDREMRRRLWCIIWNADWQMSGVLSRPVHTDQKDMRLGLPSRLEGNVDATVPTPIASVAYQAQIGVIISPLFRQLARDNSINLTLKIEKEVENWMDTFPPVLRYHRPNTEWDEKYPYVPFIRCQLNVVAYSFLLGPLKAYLIGAADPAIKGTRGDLELRAKGVDACLDLLEAAERFYKLIYPASVKYFFILFFIFDGATVLCSALAHDLDRSLPKRDRVVLALRQSLDLLQGVSHLSKTAVISAAVLRKLLPVLPLTAHERAILGWEDGRSKRVKTGSDSAASIGSSTLYTTSSRSGSNSGLNSSNGAVQSQTVHPLSYAGDQSVDWDLNPATMPAMAGSGPDFSGYSMSSAGGVSETLPVTHQQQLSGAAPPTMAGEMTTVPLEHLENLWDWGYLNMDL